jgi:DNA-binding winged helix-turn-helix (wHTH) protein
VHFFFEKYALDTDRRELRQGAELIALEPQVFDLLVYLVQHRDRVVSKDDLIEGVWGGRIVSESTLTSRITATRKAVGDSGEEQRLIRTMPRKGIRFVAEVRESAGLGSAKTSPRASILCAAPPRQDIHFCMTSDGVRIAYAELGSGPALVKTANYLTHLEYDWQSPVWSPFLHALANRHRLTRYDTRGNGLSDWDVEDISFEAFIRDLETVVDAAKLQRFALLGSQRSIPQRLKAGSRVTAAKSTAASTSELRTSHAAEYRRLTIGRTNSVSTAA